MFGVLENYHPPEWAATLNYIPKKRIRLAMADTPIHPWKVPGAPASFSISVKRDDLNGSAVSGNKARMLEFFLAEAVDQGCKHVMTCGDLQSNNCRAAAVSARQLGLTPHVFVRTKATKGQQIGCEGNVLLYRLCGAQVYLVPRTDSFDRHMEPRMQRLAQHLLASRGESSYQMPARAVNHAGLFAYVTVFEEFRQQGALNDFDDLMFACCTGKSAAGLAIANHLTGGHLRLHAICVRSSSTKFYTRLDKTLQAMGLGHLKSQDLIRFVDGYKGKGYGLSTDEELEYIQKVAAETSIVLDPTYTGKAALGMVEEMLHNTSAFKGRRVLFLHTGGIFSLFDGRMNSILEEKEETQPTIKVWPDMDDFPF